MLIGITGISNAKFKKDIIKACNYFAGLILSKRVSNFCSVDIMFLSKLDDNMDGYCEVVSTNKQRKPRGFLIQVCKKNTKDRILTILAHEIVHMKQYAMGEVDEKLQLWRGKRIPPRTDYWDTPWEIEAHGREYGMWTRFVDAHNIHYDE